MSDNSDSVPPAGESVPPGETTILLDRIRRGDEGAVAELFVRVHERLRKMAELLLRDYKAVGQREEPDDIISRMWRNLEKALLPCDPENSQAFFRVANMKMHQLLRDLSRKYKGPAAGPLRLSHDGEVPDPNSPEVRMFGGPLPPGAYTWVSDTEELRLLLVAIDRLEDEKEKDLAGYRYYQAMTATAIAEVMGLCEKTIDRRIKKLLEHLRKLMEDTVAEMAESRDGHSG
ncbi:MAG: sigma-70 family RNA polymerase sigma factor [Planctomycetota bacterium]|nr:sigma-70 family RNA polymerase sigma factor [Planctomycetota bacterium]